MKVVTFKMTDEEHALLSELAASQFMSRSNFALKATREAMEIVVQMQKTARGRKGLIAPVWLKGVEQQ